MQALAHKKHIVQGRDHGESHGGMKKCGLREPDPAGMPDLKQHHKENRSHLGKGVGLAKDAGTEVAQAGDGVEHRAGAQNRDIAAEDQHGVLPRNLMQNGQHHEHGAEQKLVRDGIEILAEHSLLLERPRQQSIQAITEAGQDKQHERPPVVAGHQVDHDEGHEHHAQQGELVGRSEQLGQLHCRSPPAWNPAIRLAVSTEAGSRPVLAVKR